MLQHSGRLFLGVFPSPQLGPGWLSGLVVRVRSIDVVISCGLVSHLGEEICIYKVYHGIIEAHRVVRI